MSKIVRPRHLRSVDETPHPSEGDFDLFRERRRRDRVQPPLPNTSGAPSLRHERNIVIGRPISDAIANRPLRSVSPWGIVAWGAAGALMLLSVIALAGAVAQALR